MVLHVTTNYELARALAFAQTLALMGMTRVWVGALARPAVAPAAGAGLRLPAQVLRDHACVPAEGAVKDAPPLSHLCARSLSESTLVYRFLM